MANPPIEQFGFVPTLNAGIPPATVVPLARAVKRPFGDWAGDVINVKSYGALGDGSHDDTANIQAALDDAFGPVTAPHGITNATLNRAVFFPPGNYIVNSPTNGFVPIANIVSDNSDPVNAAGHLTYTTSAPHGFSNGQYVYIYFASGDGDINGLRRIQNVTPTTFQTVTKPHMNSYTSGGNVISVALHVTNVFGPLIFGSGSVTTTITNNSAGVLFAYDVCKYGAMRDLGFAGVTNANSGNIGVAWEADRDPSNSRGVQGNAYMRFENCSFGTFGVGTAVGTTNYSQADTCTFYDCIWTSDRYGVWIGNNFNFNAININFIGGNFISNTIDGILCSYGTIGVIAGVNFEESGNFDIEIDPTSVNTTCIMGCSSESVNFFRESAAGSVNIIGCNQRGGGTPGTFLECPQYSVIDGCYSKSGMVKMQSGGQVRNSQFLRTDAIFKDPSWLKPVHVENVLIGATAFDTPGALEPNYVNGFFLNDATNQYFIGEKRTVTSFTASIGPTSFTGGITPGSPATLTVTAVASGGLYVGSPILSGAAAGTVITGLGTATGGTSLGTYFVTPSQTVAGGTAMTAGALLTVTVVNYGTILAGQRIVSAGPPGTPLTSDTQTAGKGTGTGGAGTYVLNNSQTVGSEPMVGGAGNTLQLFGDLPSPGATKQYTNGITTVIFDSPTTTPGAVLSVGASTNVVLVKNNGSNWIVVG